VQVLGKYVHALGKLLEPHLGDVTRDGRLGADKALGLEVLHERALGLHALVANDALDRVLSFKSLPHVRPIPPSLQCGRT